MGDMRGRALFKLDGTLRSEIERDVKGFRSVRYSPLPPHART